MANFLLRLPNHFRSLSVSASVSSNGSPPTVPQSGGPVILELPLDKIRRPLMRTRANDPKKVEELMESISQFGLQVPIDVLEVDGIYYGFSGCHRYEAHQRLGLPTIRCKVRRGTKETLRSSTLHVPFSYSEIIFQNVYVQSNASPSVILIMHFICQTSTREQLSFPATILLEPVDRYIELSMDS